MMMLPLAFFAAAALGLVAAAASFIAAAAESRMNGQEKNVFVASELQLNCVEVDRE